nr:response regulator [Pseudoruegeria sp. HB172150]
MEDDASLGELFQQSLEEDGHVLELALTCEDAVNALSREKFDLLIADLMIEGETSIPVLDFSRFFRPEAEIILVTGSSLFPNGEMHFAVSDVAYRLQKPVALDELRALAAHCGRTSGRKRVASREFCAQPA